MTEANEESKHEIGGVGLDRLGSRASQGRPKWGRWAGPDEVIRQSLCSPPLPDQPDWAWVCV